MSSYKKITRHPQTHQYEDAHWIDDYFGPHIYGVRFESDDKVYPVDMVDHAQLKEFWAQDVIDTIEAKYGPGQVLPFLKTLDHKYKARWERDPSGGEGAVEYYREYKA